MSTVRNVEPGTIWSNPDGTLTDRAQGWTRSIVGYIGAQAGLFPIENLGANGTSTTTFLREDGQWAAPPNRTAGNPTAAVGLEAVNGSSEAYMRADAAPVLSQSIAPTWTGIHTFTAEVRTFNIVMSDALTGVTDIAMDGNLTGVNALIMNGALSGPTSVTVAGSISGVTTLSMSGALSGATSISTTGNIVGGGTVTGITSVTMNGALSGVTTLSMSSTLTGVTSITMGGALSGVTSIGMNGALSGATTGAFSSDVTITTGNLILSSAGKGIKIKTGANCTMGTSTLVGGTVTVSTTAIATGDYIFTALDTPGGTPGFISAPVGSIVNGTSFVINSSSATDTSTVRWWIIKPS